jgi:NADPH-dependent curcumin reductase CurA
MNDRRVVSERFLAFVMAALCLVMAGCASYRIPTPCGEAKLVTFCKTVEIPKITVTASNTSMSVEGYASKGDAETITASAGAIGAIAGATAKAMAPK